METRRLGPTDLDITRLGFGAWAIGGPGWAYGWGKQDDADSVAAIRRALELGVNWIDTAAIYGLGHSEEIVARALRGVDRKPYVFTKCGLVPDATNTPQKNLTRASIEREIEASLRRLEVEVIDLYQIHWPDAEIEEAWEAMAKAQKAGKLRWIGVSNFDVSQMRRCQAIAPVASLQPPYSLVAREVERNELPFCRQQGLGVIVYSPMHSGLLTGAMTEERVAKLPSDDWRRIDTEFQPPRLGRNLRLVEVLRGIGEKHRVLPGQVAVAWTLRNPAVTAAIVGARSASQVDGMFGASRVELDDDDVARIAAFVETNP
jgi:aryl-alcohol dehydrogenase-like predicted oxidoreductase